MEKMIRSQSGRSMIEMLGVLAIVGVLSVGALAGYSAAMERYKVNKNNEQFQTLLFNIRDLYRDQSDYTGLDFNVVKDAGLLTPDMLNDAGDGAVNIYGGDIVIGESSLSGHSVLRIGYTKLPKKACVSMLTDVAWGGDKDIIYESSLKYVEGETTVMFPVKRQGTLSYATIKCSGDHHTIYVSSH
ncbi:MAG: hypothetical protein GY804_10500 [Alphaproteobacteria bacterium]|nr:hypothetical protein [Alphaproteobacteria bacterium]